MESYMEQSVPGVSSMKISVVYLLCRVVVILCLVAAVFFGANILGSDPAVLQVNWICAAAMVVLLVLAGFIFRCKDYLRMEYDYICRDGILEVCGVLNLRRRRTMLKLDINRIIEAGRAGENNSPARPGMRKHRWYIRERRYYLCYMEGSERHMALLEFSDEFAAHIRRQLPVGAWRG